MPIIPRRLTGLEAARRRFGPRADRIVEFFSQGDPLADATVLALQELPRERAQALLERALLHGIDSLGAADTPPPALVALCRQVEHVPFWVDRERCARGGDLFWRCRVFGGVALGFGALARAYCSAGGNKPLIRTRALIDAAPKRIANTGHFLCAVSTPDALQLGAAGYREAVHVRLMHARVRQRLLRAPDWRSDEWGVPINQADMALTALLFSHGFAGYVRALGVAIPVEEEEDLVHLWRHVGYLMGVREELLCATVTEARELADLVDVIDSGPDEDSRSLLEPLLARRPSELPIQSEHLVRLARRVFEAACRDMIGSDYADSVGLPYGLGDFGFRYALRPAVSLLDRIQRNLPGGRRRARRAGERYWAAVNREADGARRPAPQRVAAARQTRVLEPAN